MKLSKYLFLLLSVFIFAACEDEDLLPALENIEAPTDLSLAFTVAGDNSGTVAIQPNGRGATAYSIGFGDGSAEGAEVAPGESVDHVYAQGAYTVSLEARGINGKITTYSQELTVDFAAPENLVVTIVGTTGNPLSIDVSATADLETGFEVYFGDVTDEMPTSFQEGDVVQHLYEDVGDYDVRVVAVSGGNATIEETSTITIANPLLLPVDFESPFQNYEIIAFGNAGAGVVANPATDEVNNSANVGEFSKPSTSEVWAGAFLTLGQPIDLSVLNKVRVKVWSPRAGVPVTLKIENLTDQAVFIENVQSTTSANGWEELTFDFSNADLSPTYQKVVIFFDFGNAGQDESFYFDDLEQTDGNAAIQLPLNFEASDIVYTFQGFGGAGAEVIDNPDASGLNTSAKVVSSTKEFGSETWGGVFIDTAQPIDFSGSQEIKLKIWSPQAGASILLKFENPDNPDDNLEVPAITTVANQWEELTYDFSGIENFTNISRVVIFCDFGNAGDESTYYFDDIRIGN
ncbi:MAG: hypothetical protein ACI81P_000069 [Neolewinella sp.]|jgi:hypothetical protein